MMIRFRYKLHAVTRASINTEHTILSAVVPLIYFCTCGKYKHKMEFKKGTFIELSATWVSYSLDEKQRNNLMKEFHH